VPVTARPRGVVLKYVAPPVEMWKAPHWIAAMPSAASCGRHSTSRAFSAPQASALYTMPAVSGSSGWPRLAV
jgi:hypothetical protein